MSQADLSRGSDQFQPTNRLFGVTTADTLDACHSVLDALGHLNFADLPDRACELGVFHCISIVADALKAEELRVSAAKRGAA